MKRTVLLVVAVCVVGCGSSSGTSDTGSGTANGTVQGHGMTVKAAIFSTSATNLGRIALSDRADICTVLASNTTPTGEFTALVTGLVTYTGGNSFAPLATGDYTWSDGSAVTAAGRYWQGDFGFGTGCSFATDNTATGGTLTISQVGTSTGTHMKGSYSATFGSETLTGTFDAVYCAALSSPGTACGNLRSRPAVLR